MITFYIVGMIITVILFFTVFKNSFKSSVSGSNTKFYATLVVGTIFWPLLLVAYGYNWIFNKS